MSLDDILGTDVTKSGAFGVVVVDTFNQLVDDFGDGLEGEVVLGLDVLAQGNTIVVS